MSNKLLLAPSANDETSSSTVSVQNTANSLGVHDTFRFGTRTISTEINGKSTIQHRLENWEQTQDNLRLNLQRNIYGMHMPMRQLMERKIVAANPHMPVMTRSNIHLDILMGRDDTLEVGNFFGDVETGPELNIHEDMERKLRL
ncbi:hypothetical protein BOTBODRAFT_183933 [Botryobasidium botryosum FD-172 SS1]|uniref:Proteasome maturation factor UMP1 n=1 Tax=Botryobasidium botryosum (strain FD-172 SS1) TaxID=930990 RepID=A0A067MWD5_BOTB1|nr:hypothetical protein BOTBODRAFT_183933 [Botryobasidium botryosum FD-172 SS1]